MSHGLLFLASYTRSKNLADSGMNMVPWVSAAIRSAYNQKREYAEDGDNQPQVISISYVCQLPFGRGRAFGHDVNGGLNALIGGWQLSGIDSYNSGTAIGPIGGGCNTPYTNGCYASYNPTFSGPVWINGSYGSGNPKQGTSYISLNAFQNAAPYTFGNTARTAPYGLHLPWYLNESLSLSKEFSMPETTSLKVQADAFNPFNRTVFGCVGTSITGANFGQVVVKATSRASFNLKPISGSEGSLRATDELSGGVEMKRFAFSRLMSAGFCAVLATVLQPALSAQVSSWTSPTLAIQPPADTYAYAPSVIQDGTTEHIFVCENQSPNVITDSIFYYKRVAGTIVEHQAILGPGPSGAWDSNNTCDPNVIKGAFLMSGGTYQYALFYTGNNNSNSTNNQVGVAFSNSLDSGWIKYPLIFNTDGTSACGAGQPSVTSVNGAGDVLIFYTDGSLTLTQGMLAHLDISNMGSIVTYFYQAVPKRGLTYSDGTAGDYLNNFDMVYDLTSDECHIIREQHPYPTNFPTWLPVSQQVASIPGSAIWSGSGTWTVEGEVTPTVTGFARNHNAGFVRGYYGTLLDSNALTIQFDKSCEDTGDGTCTWPNVLWGYYVYEIQGNVE